MNRPKILWISDILAKTGFGVAAENNLKYLQTKYDIAAAGWNFNPADKHRRPWQCYYVPKQPNPELGITSRNILETLYPIIEKEKPDAIVAFADPWDFFYVSDEFADNDGQVYLGIRKRFPDIKIFGYLTADATPLPTYLRRNLMFYDAIAVPSEFSKTALQILLPNTPITVIYHGIDSDIFKKIHPEIVNNWKKQIGIEGKFVVGFNGRNQFRKNIPGLLRTFKEFSDSHPDAVLLFLTDIDAATAVNDVKRLINRMGLTGKVICPEAFGPKANVADEKMSLYYNCMDVYLTLSFAEGFGCPILEAMACGVPVVTTGYSAPVELIEKSGGGVLVDVAGWVNEKSTDRNFAIANETQAANYLHALYSNPDLRTKVGEKARLWASKQTWLKSGKEFDAFLAESLKKPKIDFFPISYGIEVIDKDVI